MNRERLFDMLVAYRGSRAFNQYRDVHAGLDRPAGAAVRRRNLRRYLEAFVSARFVLVGEAAGYAGCRFSGIPFTCEAQYVVIPDAGHLVPMKRPAEVARTVLDFLGEAT